MCAFPSRPRGRSERRNRVLRSAVHRSVEGKTTASLVRDRPRRNSPFLLRPEAGGGEAATIGRER